MDHDSLYSKLYTYGRSDVYPYHMPGHKRKQLGEMPEDLLRLDITEIDGFDNLHHAEGILRRLQERANALYGSDETFFLVNGSTCGILTAVSAALPEGGHILMARDCHLSAYHAAYLRGLRISYLYPERYEQFGFFKAITAAQVEAALQREPDIEAVLIVSPTYEGRIADIRAIAEVVHGRGIPLIVDEAHGAHLGFAEGFAEGSCTQGADLVVHSVHKTLAAMTQTALLHVNGDLVDRDRVKRFLHIYQSSSPSYVLMASIADALDIAAEQGGERFQFFKNRYRTLVEGLQDCRNLMFVPWPEAEQGLQDIGKLVIVSGTENVSGQWIYDRLLQKYHLQCEMAAGKYCLAMFTIADEEEAYQRMGEALAELDRELSGKEAPAEQNRELSGKESLAERAGLMEADGVSDWIGCRVLRDMKDFVPLKCAWDMPWDTVCITEAVGRPVGDFIGLYPPGAPLLTPGEIMTQEKYEQIAEYLKQGLQIQGIQIQK